MGVRAQRCRHEPPSSSLSAAFCVLFAGGAAESAAAGPAPATGSAQSAPAGDPNRVVRGTCAVCHNDRSLRGNLSLERFDATAAADHPEVAERMVRKLRAGMMPPPGPRRPDDAALRTLAETLEHQLDEASRIAPDPGSRPFQRLNRAEYAQAVRELLALDIDAGDWLPLDQMSANFDNIADAQTLSPTLLEAYLNAASAISRLAVGEPGSRAVDHTYSNSEYVSQHPWDHVEGAPYGTRGGLVVDHVFPADAEYVFGLTFTSGANTRIEDIDVSVDGERVALLHYNTDRRVDADGRGGVTTETPRVFVRAGPHRVAAAFVRRADGPYEDLIRPHDWSFAGGGSGGAGITTLPHVRDLIVSGPYGVTGLSQTPSRQRIFTCRPTNLDEARPCARRIMTRLGREAYRRALTPRDVDGLLSFFDEGAAAGGFEVGVRTALEAMLASPHFVLRLERAPVAAPRRGYRLSDADLASRLSFFLWGTPPDEELRTLADAGRLSPEELERQALRMLADPRAEALGTRFAAQWFRLQDMDKVRPDPNFFPDYDENLARAMRRETELFFADLVRENRSLLDLYRPTTRSPTSGWPCTIRHSGGGGPPLPAGGLSGRPPPRRARTRQHPRADVAREPHLAGAARQVGHGGPAGHPAPAAAPRHSGPGRHRGNPERPAPDDPRADGAAPVEPRLQLVPPADRPDRAGPRQLRRHREVAGARARRPPGHARRLL